MSRQCDAHQCTASVASGRFLCGRHWRMVALDTQRTINSRFRACRKDFGFLSDAAYLQACVDAITSIVQAEGHADAPAVGQASAYGRLLAGVKRRAAK